MHLQILIDNEKAKPFYESHGTYHEGDAGLDLFCVEEQEVPASGTAWVNLGIKAAAHRDKETGKRPSPSLAFLILPRSSISKTPLRVANSIGLIDAGYRGCLIAALDNRSDKPYKISAGDRLVQAVSFDGSPITFELVESLDDTSRGAAGYGSTNKMTKTSTHDHSADLTAVKNADVTINTEPVKEGVEAAARESAAIETSNKENVAIVEGEK